MNINNNTHRDQAVSSTWTTGSETVRVTSNSMSGYTPNLSIPEVTECYEVMTSLSDRDVSGLAVTTAQSRPILNKSQVAFLAVCKVLPPELYQYVFSCFSDRWLNAMLNSIGSERFKYFIEDEEICVNVFWELNRFMQTPWIRQGQSINDQDSLWYTPLQRAVFGYEFEKALTLLSIGADTEVVNGSGNKLIVCGQIGVHNEISKLIIDSCKDINARNQLGETALMHAIRHDNVTIVKYLIDKGVDINAMDKEGMTALHYAIKADYLHIVNLLIEAGADVNAEDNWGNTPLIRAIYSNRGRSDMGMVEVLLANGADVMLSNSSGSTPLGIARLGFMNRAMTYSVSREVLDFLEQAQKQQS